MTAKEIIKVMPQALKDGAAEGVDATIQYNLSEPMYHVIKDGNMEVHEGQAETATVTLDVKDDDFVNLINGNLNGMTAFMTGKLKVKGDLMLAQRLMTMFDANKVS